jgi:hypothetical protein
VPHVAAYPPTAQLKISATRLATIAKVPANNCGEFCSRITGAVLRLRDRDRRSTGAKPGGLLIEAADAARKLDQAFSRMNKQDLKWVEHITQTQGQAQFAAGEISNLGATITNIHLLLQDAIGKPASLPKYLASGSHKVADQMLRELVFDLLSAASDTGGRFTFNKNSGGGTLADALNRLRQHLPKGLVPDPLPATTIQRLRMEFLGFLS